MLRLKPKLKTLIRLEKMQIQINQHSTLVNLEPIYAQNQVAINPVINELAEENDQLLVAMFNTKKIFQENKTAMQNTIDTLAKKVEGLEAAQMQAESRVKEQSIMHEAALKSTQEKNKLRNEKIANTFKQMSELIDFKEEVKEYSAYPPINSSFSMNSLFPGLGQMFPKFNQPSVEIYQSCKAAHDKQTQEMKNQDIAVANKEKELRLGMIKKLNDQLKTEFEQL